MKLYVVLHQLKYWLNKDCIKLYVDFLLPFVLICILMDDFLFVFFHKFIKKERMKINNR